MLKKLEVSHLKTLNALYDARSITVAAEKLNISQQAISLQLSKLRELLDDKLFVRSNYGVSPTYYAKEIEHKVKDILAQINDIQYRRDIPIVETNRTISICCTDYTQFIIGTKLIKQIRERSPNVKVIIKNIEMANLNRMMLEGEVDLVFTSGGYVPDGLLSETLFSERYVCAASSEFFKHIDSLEISELIKYDFIVTNPGPANLKGSADDWFHRVGQPRNISMSSPTFSLTKHYLKETNMVSFIPSRLMPCRGLKEIKIDKYPPGFEVVVAYHHISHNDDYINWLINFIKRLPTDIN